MKTINEIYKEIKQLRDSLEEYIKTNDTSAAKVVLISNLKIYNDILNQLEELAIYKRALELENEERFKNIDSIWMIEDDNRTKFINSAEELTNYFLDQAKEELEKGEE